MTRIVNLMASDIWSDVDITNRTEAMLRAQFSLTDEQVLNRKVTGAQLGIYQLTDADKAQVAAFAAATLASREAGDAARADMATLRQILDVEAAQRRLAAPEVQPEVDGQGQVTNQDAVDADAAERAAAQAVVDAASPEVMEWVLKRNPPPPPEPEVDNVAGQMGASRLASL